MLNLMARGSSLVSYIILGSIREDKLILLGASCTD